MTKISPPHDLHSLHKESWAQKNWCFWTVVLEKNLESPLDSKIKPVSPKWNQPWISVGRTDAKAEAPILWPLDVKSWLIGKDWCWERLRAREGGDRGWDGWMASLTQWTWVWANREAWCAAVQRFGEIRHNLATEQQQQCLTWSPSSQVYYK